MYICISGGVLPAFFFLICLAPKKFSTFSELIVNFPATIRTMKMRQRSHTCESLPSQSKFDTVLRLKNFIGKNCFVQGLQKKMLFFLTVSCLEHLLDNGADPSMVNSKGYSAVHYAAYHGNKQNLELVSLHSE